MPVFCSQQQITDRHAEPQEHSSHRHNKRELREIKVTEGHHYHQSFMELGHLLTRSGLTHLEFSLKVYHDFFCQLGNIVL